MGLIYRAAMISSSTSVSNRLHHVDALSVCLFHLTTIRPGFPPDESLLKAVCNFGYLGVDVFFIISGFIIPVALSKSGYRVWQYFDFSGKISYSIYLIHIPVGTRVVNLFSVTPFFRDHGYLVILLAVIVTLVVPYGFYRMIERSSIYLSQKIVYKRPS